MTLYSLSSTNINFLFNESNLKILFLHKIKYILFFNHFNNLNFY